jgi:cytochrome c553
LGGGRITSGSEAAISLSKAATSIPTGGSRPYHASRYRARIRRLARPIIPRRQFPAFPGLIGPPLLATSIWLPGTPPICYRPRRGDDGMMTSKNSLIIAPVILLLSAPALAQQPDARRGLALAREHCAPCHAIDNTSESPRAAAPPFRELRLKYAVSDLQRPLTQGPHTRFQFEPSQIEALMAYLKTLDR